MMPMRRSAAKTDEQKESTTAYMSMSLEMGGKFMRFIPIVLNESASRSKFVLRVVSLLALCKR